MRGLRRRRKERVGVVSNRLNADYGRVDQTGIKHLDVEVECFRQVRTFSFDVESVGACMGESGGGDCYGQRCFVICDPGGIVFEGLGGDAEVLADGIEGRVIAAPIIPQ